MQLPGALVRLGTWDPESGFTPYSTLGLGYRRLVEFTAWNSRLQKAPVLHRYFKQNLMPSHPDLAARLWVLGFSAWVLDFKV